MNVHDANALQFANLIAKGGTHPSDLPVQPLGQDDAEDAFANFRHGAWFGDSAEDAHAAGHSLQKSGGNRLVHCDNVLFIMVIFRTQDFIDNIAIVRQENQALGILVQPADRKMRSG